uniref:Uncharacterized protein n=1 Tax=Balaenoptera musculus TaxID=9771 RepID=A0A8C0CC09_BALMU
RAVQYTKAMQSHKLDLQEYKIPVIENLGATLDHFDAIDFSGNVIRKLGGFSLVRRLKKLLVNTNRICHIGDGLGQALTLRNLLKKKVLDFQKVELKECQEFSTNSKNKGHSLCCQKEYKKSKQKKIYNNTAEIIKLVRVNQQKKKKNQ